MTQPVVTAVVVTRDRPVLLRRALAAIEAQDVDGVVETVVVFDRSAPDESLASDDPRRPVRVVANERTPGLQGGRNTGVDHARAPVIAFCDDDDEWLPTKLTQQLALLEREPHTDVVITGITIVYGDREVPRRAPATIGFADLLRDRVTEAHPSTFVVRTEAFNDTIGPVDESIPGGYAEDYEWLLRAARLADVRAVPEPLVRVHWHAASYYAERWEMIDEALGHLLAEYPEFDDEPAGLARILGQRAFARAAAGRRRDALRAIRLTLRANWREPRAYVAAVVAAGVPADRVLAGLHRFGRGV